MTSATLFQEAGFIFPNVAKAQGVIQYYKTAARQSWRGKYNIGAGIVTPWGDVKVYGRDYSTDWQVYGNGAGKGGWN